MADEGVQVVLKKYYHGDKQVNNLLEPMQGIPYAHNAALNFAKNGGYLYLAFIDDAFASKD